MSRYSLAHLSDPALLASTRSLVATDRATTAGLLAHLAEVDARRLYLPAAYPSMFAWCVGHLKLSEDSAAKRIHAARFPQPDLATLVTPVPSAGVAVTLTAPGVQGMSPEHAPGHMKIRTSDALETSALTLGAAPAPVTASAVPSSPAMPGVPPARIVPLAPERFGLQVTVSRATHDKLQRARELLGHSVPNGDLAQVLDRALDALLTRLERERFAKCARPGVSRRRADGIATRRIPAAIKRQVWERDGGQCTFTSPEGQR